MNIFELVEDEAVAPIKELIAAAKNMLDDESWDAVLRMSEAQQREHEAWRLREVVRVQTQTCGSCDKWMKSRQCPKEHNVAGMSRGPSCGGLKCGEYVQSASAARSVAAATAKLAEPTTPEREATP